MDLLSMIKADAQKAGSSRGKFFYVTDGEKRRVRFLQDLNEGFVVNIHSNYEKQITVPCQEIFGKKCIYDEMEDIKTRPNYVWSVYDYESNDVRLIMYPMNNCTPVGAITAAYENYGTLLDRDFIISVTGKGTNKVFTVMPMDKNKFRNDKAKPYSKSAFLKILNEAYPDDSGSNEETDGEWEDESEGGSQEVDYSNMTPKELFKLCKERGISALLKKGVNYYINLLKEDDKAHEEWGSEGEDEEWEDE